MLSGCNDSAGRKDTGRVILVYLSSGIDDDRRNSDE